MLAKDYSSSNQEGVDMVSPQEAMAKSEFIAAAYEGFTKDIDKLQQVMIKGQETEDKIKQCRKKVDG